MAQKKSTLDDDSEHMAGEVSTSTSLESRMETLCSAFLASNMLILLVVVNLWIVFLTFFSLLVVVDALMYLLFVIFALFGLCALYLRSVKKKRWTTDKFLIIYGKMAPVHAAALLVSVLILMSAIWKIARGPALSFDQLLPLIMVYSLAALLTVPFVVWQLRIIKAYEGMENKLSPLSHEETCAAIDDSLKSLRMSVSRKSKPETFHSEAAQEWTLGASDLSVWCSHLNPVTMTIKGISPDNRRLADEVERRIDAELEKVSRMKSPKYQRST